jgi:hypothetical protein
MRGRSRADIESPSLSLSLTLPQTEGWADMTQPNRINGETNSSGTVIFTARFRRRPQNAAGSKPAPHLRTKRLHSWLVLFVIFLAIMVPPTLAAFTAFFALWLLALSLALGLIIVVDLARRSIRWARLPLPV